MKSDTAQYTLQTIKKQEILRYKIKGLPSVQIFFIVSEASYRIKKGSKH